MLKKSKKDNATLFIDALDEFIHEGNKNKLSDTNIVRILEAFVARKDDAYFARLVENDKIAENDYNISVSSYVEQLDTLEVVDIEALNRRIAEIVARQKRAAHDYRRDCGHIVKTE